jgi:hypothetical protein
MIPPAAMIRTHFLFLLSFPLVSLPCLATHELLPSHPCSLLSYLSLKAVLPIVLDPSPCPLWLSTVLYVTHSRTVVLGYRAVHNLCCVSTYVYKDWVMCPKVLILSFVSILQITSSLVPSTHHLSKLAAKPHQTSNPCITEPLPTQKL